MTPGDEDVFDEVYTRKEANDLRGWRREDPSFTKFLDAHRKEAHGDFDRMLEEGEITPEEAQAMKRKWDKRHGYTQVIPEE